jgi:hypothetical protein
LKNIGFNELREIIQMKEGLSKPLKPTDYSNKRNLTQTLGRLLPKGLHRHSGGAGFFFESSVCLLCGFTS